MTFARSLISLIISVCILLRCAESCVETCQMLDGWNSMIIIGSRSARYVVVTWTPESMSSLYVVQHRLRNTQVYTSSEVISSTQFNITSLSPETDYEVQVCREISTSSPDDCGNCLLCISTVQAQEPPSPPVGVQVRADSSESITVLWSEPEFTNGRISNYSVICSNSKTGVEIINKTVFSILPVTEFFLEPNCTYVCSIVAYNDHGPSLAQQAFGTTPPVTTVPSFLLLVYEDGVEYAELTDSAVDSNMLTYERLLNTSTTATIKGLDYHFYREEIYMTQENHCITRIPVMLVESSPRNILRSTAEVEVLFRRDNSIDLGSITVDWVNDEVYWVERQDGYRIMRAIIHENGSVVDLFCVVKLSSSLVSHLAVDPVHGYFYWSDTTTIYRAPLHNVRLNNTLDSCVTDIPSKVSLINNVQLETFALEPSEAIYYVGYDSCFDVPEAMRMQTNRSVLGTTLNAAETRVYTGATVPIVTTDSFDRRLFFSVGNTVIAVGTSEVANCPTFPSIKIFSRTNDVLVLRTYRSVKQPLPVPPGPPTDIYISSTSSEANITWKQPLFIGEFFSEGAFANWMYMLRYRAVRPLGNEISVNVSATSVLLQNLQPETVYEILISACGPGGCQSIQNKLVFSTKSADSDNFLLLVATGTGIISAKINGSSALRIGGMSSIESNGVAYDSHTDHFYWSVEGGQGKLYMSNSSRSEDSQVLFSTFRRNPFSLKFDWVARRLFWVEDGDTVRGPKHIISGSLENPSLTPEVFAEVDNIQTTVLDSLNGLLFWANESSIHAMTLSGLIFEPICYAPQVSPFGLTVDANRRKLYWLNDANDGYLVVNQLEYTTTSCDSSSIVAQDIAGLTFSSSSTVMAYAADTLFIGSLSTSQIYTVASDLANVGSDQALALGLVQFNLQSGEDLSYRDMVVVSESLQMLPNTLQPTDRQKELLTPSVAASPPLLSGASTASNTIVEWGESSLMTQIRNTPVYYVLEYNLSSTNTLSVTSDLTSVDLEGIPPQTTLTARVVAYSLWYPSTATQYSSISSLPALPGTVTNIRAYVYKPTRGSDDLTALVLWDEPDFVVSNYIMSVFDVNNVELYPSPQVLKLFTPDLILYQSPNADTHYIISARDYGNQVNYFLTSGTSYKIQITAVNPSGSGNPSPLYTLDVAAPDYPQNLLIANESGVHLFGIDANLNHALPTTSQSPLAVDTISRVVYWYHESINSIVRQSLNSDGIDPYLHLPSGNVLLAMSYDWVGMELYFILRDQKNCIKIMKVSAVNRNVLKEVVPNLQESVSPTAQIRMTVDPFGGFLHWLAVDTNKTSLHQINLRNVSIGSTLLTQSRTRRQTNDFLSLNLSSALLLDPHSGNLLLSDLDSGDIVNCSVTDTVCATLISGSINGDLQPCNGTALPANAIALNEQRLYWISTSSSCVFAVELNDPNNLLLISSYTASDIFTLSPGQQPLPTQDCLAPNVEMSQDRPNPDIVTERNTSVTISLAAPPLDSHCNDIVISFPPVTFGINVEDGDRSIPGFPTSTFNMEYTIDGLRPFTEYEVELSVTNMYTKRRSYRDTLFSTGTKFMTTEGVPDPPTGVTSFVFGTSDIQINWTSSSMDSLRGPIDSLTYYVKVYNNGYCSGELGVQEPSVLVNESVGVIRGVPQDIAVIVSNSVHNSTETRVQVNPWPLTPKPVVVNRTNTTIVVKVVLDDILPFITHIGVQICDSEATGSCSCPNTLREQEFQAVNSSAQVTVRFPSLQAHSLYCLQSIGMYNVIERFKSDPEITEGGSVLNMTDVGVPDPPFIRLREDMKNILEWDIPNSRGREIILYKLLAIRNGAPTADSIEIIVNENNIDLSARRELTTDIVYNIQVFATNAIGDSNSSNIEPYTRLQSGSPLNLATIAGISFGSVVFLVVLCLIFVIALFLFCNGRKKELASLSYMYGPDHELSNLRDAYRHAHANNPHYTWSRDDYVCTDEEIELLNKFPRQSLKLETFIDRGEFGEVYQGNAIDILGPDTGPTPVAVKTLRKGTTYDEQRKFLSEASLMSKFNHPNIVKVLGVCVDNDPVYIIMELMPAGDLLKFLRDAKRDHGPTLLTLPEQIQIALDVANGCRYLEQQHYIHRDIAARNCLVSSKGADRVVKIGDFGLARDLYSSDYYQVEGQRKLPVRWMAPEALLQGKFTIESDIWSYGVLLWEIMTLGNQPYPGRINQEVLQYVTGGGRLDRPEKCPAKIYHLMQSCWKRYSSERPHFDQIVTIVTTFLNRVKRPGSTYYSDSESDDGESNLQRQPSGKLPSRTPSLRSGILSLARTGSMKLRNSFRRHGSIHRRDEHSVSQFSEEGQGYRERGPF